MQGGSVLLFAGIVLLSCLHCEPIFGTSWGTSASCSTWWIQNALAAGYQIAHWTGLSTQDRQTLALETGIQNSGLGVTLIFDFFDGLGGGGRVVGRAAHRVRARALVLLAIQTGPLPLPATALTLDGARIRSCLLPTLSVS
jgi:hypothetical protein